MKTKFLLTIMLCYVLSASFAQNKGLKDFLMTDERKEAQAKLDAENAALDAYLDKYYGGRPESPDPDVANFEDNIPVKKESFTDKMARYNKQGFKVGVVIKSGAIYTRQPSTASGPSSGSGATRNIGLSGSGPSLDEKKTEAIVNKYVKTMNDAFSTDVFEVVDMKKIPVIGDGRIRQDNWVGTKYKTIVTFSISPEYDYTVSGKEYNAIFRVSLDAPIMEYVNDKKRIKQKYIKYNGDLGHYNAARKTTKEPFGVKTTEELHVIINPPLGDELFENLDKIFDEKIEKYIEKLKK